MISALEMIGNASALVLRACHMNFCNMVTELYKKFWSGQGYVMADECKPHEVMLAHISLVQFHTLSH